MLFVIKSDLFLFLVFRYANIYISTKVGGTVDHMLVIHFHILSNNAMITHYALIMVIMVMRKSWMKVCVQHTRASIKVISEAFRKEQTGIITLHLMREGILARKCKTFGLGGRRNILEMPSL